jgi:pimeloyl-ACP methyl ester carboxylesterase
MPKSGVLLLTLCVSMLAQTTSSPIRHRTVAVNGINMHIAEQGEGPLVLMVHGFPELWYSWRHIIPAVAGAGYKAVAPDMRGYGQTDAPKEIDAYTMNHHVADLVALVKLLGYEQAVIMGHDWGASAASTAAAMRPDVFRALVLLSVPYGARGEGGLKPTEGMQRRVPAGQQFYQYYFQAPGVAEKELEADVRKSLRMLYYSTSGSIPKEHRWRYVFGKNEKALDGCVDPGDKLPSWLKPEDLEYFVKEFSRTGFHGGLNWYRAQDAWWAMSAFLMGRKLSQATLYIGGEDDAVVEFARAGVDRLEQSVPNLWRKVLLKGVGHWTEQEAPEDVKRHVLEFLRHIDARK